MATSDCLYEWVICFLFQPVHSKMLIHSGTNNQLSLWINNWIIHWIHLFKKADSVQKVNKYEGVIELSTQLIRSNKQNHSGTKQVTVTSESLNHSLKRFIQTHWFTQESLSHWIIPSTDSLKQTKLSTKLIIY